MMSDAPVIVESSPAEASALLNVLTMIIRQPDSAGDLYTVFNRREIGAMGRYANRLAAALTQPPLVTR